jgi:hypothetical protein
MTTYRVLAEAAAFHRRRLVAAFVSGSREGHRVEPPRGGRCVVLGLLVASLCAAGVLVGAHVGGHPELSWERHRVHVSP